MEKIIKKKEQSTIDQLREIRDKMSAETQNMTFEQLQKYVEYQLQGSMYSKAVWM
ncbi:MAG: hypothetical protein LBI45_04440 [Bacteroidales bacterium]|jgi:hypothetical protein|nr:hypothetical protein [Bacteroidales bacterium]